jgi:hypothetical protein
MTHATRRPGRPKTSTLSRQEQLRVAKRAHRERQRRAGWTEVNLRLPTEDARRLRVASSAAHFPEALRQFLDDAVLDLQQWPALRELAWNRAERWIAAEDAFALYERNWRFVDRSRLTNEESALLERLKNRFGGGVLNG